MGTKPFIVLVCGGRTFGVRTARHGIQTNEQVNADITRVANENACLANVLSAEKAVRELEGKHELAMISGGAPGADTLAYQWALLNEVPCIVYPAQWKKYGTAAGPIRNQLMLERGEPDMVIAFPGGKGTADMLRRARSAGVPVLEVTP